MDTKGLLVHVQLLLLFCLHLYLDSADGYITGAPAGACVTMVPGHGVGGQVSRSPYTITVSSPTFRCKQDITVTLNSTGNVAIKGFLCQARTDVNTYETVGQLTSKGTVPTKNNCGINVASLTHANNNDKTSVSFNWRSNVHDATEIYIVCTIVQNHDTFWIKQPSNAITYQNGGACTPDVDGNGDGTGGATNIQPSATAVIVLASLLALKLT